MKKSSWENPLCNLCGSNNQKVVYSDLTYWEYKGNFQIVECINCSLVFLSPRPPISAIAKYYEVDNYFGRNIQDKSRKMNDLTERNNTFSPTYSLISRKVKKGSILDIGAGTGLFLSKFKEEGWIVDGVELTSDAVSYAKSHYKITLKKGDFFDFNFKKNSIDVITLNGALEHLYSPQETLQKAFTILKKNGMVVISVPNVESFGRTIFGRDWFPWQPPRHLYHFSPKTLTQMLRQAGFRQIRVQHNYHLQNKYILFQSLRYGKSPKFRKSLKGGLISKEKGSQAVSIKIKIGKIIWNVISEILARVEPLFKKGEVLLVSAEKL